jgi:hypothetical protein
LSLGRDQCFKKERETTTTTDIITTENFFSVLHGEEYVNFRCLNDSVNIAPSGNYNVNMIPILKQANDNNCEIYFVVNSGGYKDEYITKFNAVFTDLDCGKDDNKQYFPLEIVEQYKKKTLEILHQFPFKPTYIVDTRNGFHVYWALNAGATLGQFNECEHRLISYFDADTKAKNPARLMRVPGYYWRKYPNNPYLCKVIEFNDARYNIQNIINFLPEVPEVSAKQGLKHNNNKKYIALLPIVDGKTSHDNNFKLIRGLNVAALQEIISPIPVLVKNNAGVYDYLKKQDLFLFLGVNSNPFNCLVHPDENPSAYILDSSKDNDHLIYYCHGCEFKGTIIQLTQKITGLNMPDTLRFLRKVYKIDFIISPWKKEQMAILNANIKLVDSTDFKEMYPEVYGRVWHYISDLCFLNELAKECVQTENYTDPDGNPIFFASTRHIARKLEKDPGSVSKRIGLFAILGLINKSSESGVPEFLLKRAKQEAKKNGYKYSVTFFSIPNYASTMDYITERAKLCKENHYTMSGNGWEWVFRTFGKEEADRLYPQMEGHKIPPGNEQLAQDLERAALLLIEQKGYVTEDEIINLVHFKYGSFRKVMLKRIMSDMLNKYDLVRIPANKELKQRYGMDAKGYPRIIVSRASLEFIS